MVDYKEKIVKGKESGIRFICKKHWYLSMRSPCPECVKQYGLKMPKPLPVGTREKKEMNEILDLFDGKVIKNDKK